MLRELRVGQEGMQVRMEGKPSTTCLSPLSSVTHYLFHSAKDQVDWEQELIRYRKKQKTSVTILHKRAQEKGVCV